MKRVIDLLRGVMVVFVTAGTLWAVDPVLPQKTTWDSGDAEGWTSIGAAVSFPLTGGVTGGFFRLEDNVNNDMTIYAPSHYLGDYTALDGAAYFSVAVQTLYQGSDIWPPFGTLTLSGPGGKYAVDLGNPPPVSSGWVILSVSLSESLWVRQSGTWSGLLQNVTQVSLDVEGGSAITEVNGVDNFELAAGALDTPRIVDIRVNHCGRAAFGWYFIGLDGIERVDITYSKDMAGAGVLANYQFSGGIGEPVPPAPIFIDYNSATRTTTLAWATPLLNRSVTVVCNSGATKIRAVSMNVPLDGELSDPIYPVFPSGDGTAGGEAQFTARHLTGDLNRDGIIDLLDMALLAGNWLVSLY